MIKRYTDHRIEDIFSKLSRFLVQTKIEKHISVYTTPVELKSKLYVSFDKIDYDHCNLYRPPMWRLFVEMSHAK